MIDFLKTLFLANPLSGLGWMVALIAFVGCAIVLTAWFRRDVEIVDFELEQWAALWNAPYFFFTLIQQIILISLFYWLARLGVDSVVSTTLLALLFGFVGHLGNRGLMFATAALAFAYLPHWSHFHNIYVLWMGHFTLSRVYWRFTPSAFSEEMKVWRR